MIKKIFLAGVLIFAGFSFIFAQSKTDEKAKADIRAVMDAQSAAWNAGSIDGFMKGYWNSPELVFVSGDNVTKGWRETTDRYKKGYNTREKMGTLTFSELDIKVLSKDSAVVLGRWKVATEPKNSQGRFTLIFRKFKDGWKVVHDHTS